MDLDITFNYDLDPKYNEFIEILNEQKSDILESINVSHNIKETNINNDDKKILDYLNTLIHSDVEKQNEQEIYEEKIIINDNATIKNKKNVRFTTDEDKALEKLEKIYESVLLNDTVEESTESFKDELKKACYVLEKNIIMESTLGYNLKNNLYYINIDTLHNKLKSYTNDKYTFSIFYQKPSIKTYNQWCEINYNGENTINEDNKYLKACIKIFSKTNKFRKNINNYKIRAFKNTFLIYKTDNKVDLFCIVKEKI